MVPYYGDFPVNATVYIPINTFDSNDPAASVTVTNLVNTDVHIHKDGGTTQRNNAAGITMSIDFDSITGNHLLSIDTSDNTVADFFQAGHEYQVRIEGATVDAGTINAWVGCFSLERANGILALLKNGTYGLSALESLVDDIGAAGAGLTAVPWNAAWDAEVQSECTDALNAYDPPTKAELDTAQGAVTLANGAHGGAAATITLQTPIAATVPDTQKVDVNTVKTQTVTCAAGVTILASVGTATASTAQTGDAYARLGAPAGASVSADVAGVKADTAAILTDTGTTLDTLIKDIPTVAEFEARTKATADYFDPATDEVTPTAASKTGYAIGVGGIAANAFAASALDAAALAADAGTEIANAIKAAVIEAQGSYTIQQALSIILAVCAGVTADNGATLKTPNGAANRVAATIDANANRTAMTLTPSA